MERVAPPSLNYDNILPLAIESRSNRRTFVPQNGTVFTNTTGATIVRIDVNADSMLDCAHSYLSCEILNETGATNTISLEQFCPSWIQRLRIESGGVVIEDINEYARLYAMMVLNQCPKDYIVHNLTQQGLYSIPHSTAFMTATAGGFTAAVNDAVGFTNSAVSVTTAGGGTGDFNELQYPAAAQLILQGRTIAGAVGVAAGAGNQPTAGGLITNGFNYKINNGQVKKQSFPLLSGFLNMDKYLPLIMMNAGFTIEIHLCDARRIGVAMVESGVAANILQAGVEPVWSVRSIEYVAHLIDLDRAFYDRLRMVMEQSGGVLQLAGQTYRHFAAQTPANVGPHTISIPARVKSVKSIFATFIANAQRNAVGSFSSSVFQRANVSSFRFEIGSVRYPAKDVVTGPESLVELQKAFGKLGDYQHQMAYGLKHCFNNGTARSPHTINQQSLSAFTIGYDFEAFQRVSLEAGINTADRSLPINLIYNKDGAGAITHVDVYVLCDAIYYINLDGTVSVSV